MSEQTSNVVPADISLTEEQSDQIRVLEVLDLVNDFLAAGDVAGAQEAAIEFGSVLPASLFERVLKAAIAQNDISVAYIKFCDERFGRTVLANMVWEAVA